MYRILAYTAQKKIVTIEQDVTVPTKQLIKQLFIGNHLIREILVMRRNTESDRKQGRLCPEECELHALSVFGTLIFLQ